MASQAKEAGPTPVSCSRTSGAGGNVGLFRVKRNFSNILDQLEQDRLHRLYAKVPQWACVEGISVPGNLALEQCSSSAAAIYKASLAPGGVIADLTSGLGVDVWAFAKIPAAKVYYNDIRPELCRAAADNFRLLGLDNVEISNLGAEERLSTLGRVDMIFADPARRSESGRKLFRLEDCSPDITALMPSIWEHTDLLMVKLSPMADISLVSARLEGLAEVHVTGTSTECKELLCILRKGWNSGYSVSAAVLDKESAQTVNLVRKDGLRVPLSGEPAEGDVLLEPVPVLSKTGMYPEICETFGLRQLDPSVHLFSIADDGKDHKPADRFFRKFRIKEIAGFGRQAFREIGKRYPVADVSARNLPLKSEELKMKMGVTGSGDTHIFGVGVQSRRLLLVTERVF